MVIESFWQFIKDFVGLISYSCVMSFSLSHDTACNTFIGFLCVATPRYNDIVDTHRNTICDQNVMITFFHWIYHIASVSCGSSLCVISFQLIKLQRILSWFISSLEIFIILQWKVNFSGESPYRFWNFVLSLARALYFSFVLSSIYILIEKKFGRIHVICDICVITWGRTTLMSEEGGIGNSLESCQQNSIRDGAKHRIVTRCSSNSRECRVKVKTTKWNEMSHFQAN